VDGRMAYAQQCNYRCSEGIPLLNVLINLAIIIALFVLVIKYLKSFKKRAVAGITIFLVGVLIIVLITPYQIGTFLINPKNIDEHCIPSHCTVFTITDSDLRGNPKLASFLSDAKSKSGHHTTTNYFDELAIVSTVKYPNFDPLSPLLKYTYETFVIKYQGDYYEVRLSNVFDDLVGFSTVHPYDVLFWNLYSTLFFYSTIWQLRKQALEIRNDSGVIQSNDGSKNFGANSTRWISRLSIKKISLAISGGIIMKIVFIFLPWQITHQIPNYPADSITFLIELIIFGICIDAVVICRLFTSNSLRAFIATIITAVGISFILIPSFVFTYRVSEYLSGLLIIGGFCLLFGVIGLLLKRNKAKVNTPFQK
jgi:hypothetical protein